jgi:hypothetical protein
MILFPAKPPIRPSASVSPPAGRRGCRTDSRLTATIDERSNRPQPQSPPLPASGERAGVRGRYPSAAGTGRYARRRDGRRGQGGVSVIASPVSARIASPAVDPRVKPEDDEHRGPGQQTIIGQCRSALHNVFGAASLRLATNGLSASAARPSSSPSHSPPSISQPPPAISPSSSSISPSSSSGLTRGSTGGRTRNSGTMPR